jgi:hypothetical protein
LAHLPQNLSSNFFYRSQISGAKDCTGSERLIKTISAAFFIRRCAGKKLFRSPALGTLPFIRFQYLATSFTSMPPAAKRKRGSASAVADTIGAVADAATSAEGAGPLDDNGDPETVGSL